MMTGVFGRDKQQITAGTVRRAKVNIICQRIQCLLSTSIMSAAPSPAPQPLPPQQSSTRQKKQPLQMGIAAGAEDAKYQAKYKELKRKVKDIEQVRFFSVQTKSFHERESRTMRNCTSKFSRQS